MKALLLILGTLFFNPPDEIYWRKLSWTDFKQKPPTNKIAAHSTTGFDYTVIGKDGKFFFTAVPFFDQDESFTNVLDDTTLRHEQIHFDLCELYGRLIQRKLKQFQGKDMILEAKKVYDELVVKWKLDEELFDEETEHGLNREKEYIWEANIEYELLHNLP